MTTAYTVTGVLDRRQDDGSMRLFRRCLGAAVALHLAGAAAAWLVPRLSRAEIPPLEFVSVQIVPAARLGVEKPAPPKPAPVQEPPRPAPKPEAPPAPTPAAVKPARPEPKPPQPKAAEPVEPPPEVQGSERGSVSGLAVGASIAGLDNPDFTYGYYVDQMLSMIQRNWVRPLVGSGVEATISYRIARDGRITEVKVSRSSGINSFDLAALRAVQSSSPLPPLPRAFRDSWLGVHLIFR